MGKFIDLTGQKFGRLIVLERSNICKKGHTTFCLCQCNCGNKRIISYTSLKRGNTKSCGCYNKEMSSQRIIKLFTKHNMSETRIYHIWEGMKARCYNKNDNSYKNYGGRGIKICKEWKHDFLNFYNWAMANGYKENLTIDRINVNGNYEPENCRWVNMIIQNNNTTNNRKITYKNKIYTISELSRLLKINYRTLYSRINNNWSENELSLKANYNNKKIRGGK